MNNTSQPAYLVETDTLSTQHSINNQKGNSPIIVGVLVLLFVVGGAYYLRTQNNKSTSQVNQSATISVQSTPTSDPSGLPVHPLSDTTNWKTYTNTDWKIAFKYPPNWQAMTDQGESGMLVKASDLKMTDYSNVEKGAFLYGPYVPNVLPLSWDKVFDDYTNERIEILNENIIIDGQETKVGLLKKANAVTMLVYYKYPTTWNITPDFKIQWSFINLITTPSDYESNKQIFKDILSTFKFTN